MQPSSFRSQFAAHSRILATGLVLVANAAAAADAATLALQQVWSGEVAADQYSYSMAGVGDIDNDGYADLLIGANVNDEGADGAGKVYVHLGGANGFVEAAFSCVGTVPHEKLGGAVQGGADLNGDGIDDWVIGAPGLGATATLPGRAYIYWGGTQLNGVPDLVLEGATAAGQFGASLCVIPDFDGDGYADLAVGAPRDGDGRVFLFRGGPSMDVTPDAILSARLADKRFGASLAWLPDQNNDGRDELLVGSPRSSAAATWAGAALLYYGSANLDTQVDVVFLGEAAGDEFGSSLACTADLNGDAAIDIVIGAAAANVAALVDAGKAYLFLGGGLLDTTADAIFMGEAADDRFATALISGFDWDGDGQADLAIGAPQSDRGANNAGVCFIYQGGVNFDVVSDAALVGTAAAMQFAGSLAAINATVGGNSINGRGVLLVGDYLTAAGHAQSYADVTQPTDVAIVPGRTTAMLLPPWPNPFNPHVRSALVVDAPGTWSVTIVDARGRSIAHLLTATLGTGRHDLRWNGLDHKGQAAASGVYWIRARGPRQQLAARITLVR